MLEVTNLSAAYGQHPSLNDISIKVKTGEVVVILGANGAGKSTLLRAISGICEGKVSGDVTLNGESLTGLSSDAIVEKGVALVPEGRGIFGDLTVKENLMLGAYSASARETERENLERVLMQFPKLRERQGQIARTMSGGEQQMVAIGRAIMSAMMPLMRVLEQGGKFIQCIKHGLTLRGIDAGPPRRPLQPLNKDDKRELAEVIRTMNTTLSQITGQVIGQSIGQTKKRINLILLILSLPFYPAKHFILKSRVKEDFHLTCLEQIK